ncbi:unnamed protein product [Urochloa humidicola]
MANAKIVVVALVAVLSLLQVSSAVARRHGKPDPCAAADDDEAAGLEDLPGGMRHKKAPHHHCRPARHGGGIPAVMTVNGFKRGEDGGGPSACDGHFHGDGELIVALSTEWFARGRRCHRRIRITSAHGHGRTVEARVVDECDSHRGCRRNIVDSSPAVWKALGLDTGVGEVPVTWSDA